MVSNNTGGNITLAANGNSDNDDLDINANVTATGQNAGVHGNIYLYAGDTITIQGTPSARTISAAGTGTILLSASTNYNNGGGLTNGYNGGSGEAATAGRVVMQDGSIVQSQDGNITLRCDGDVQLSMVNANRNNDGAVGDVTVAADYAGVGGGMNDLAGSITDIFSGGNNVFGNLGTFTAGTGIGSGDAINVLLTTLYAENTGLTGNIEFIEAPAGGDIDVNRIAQTNAGNAGLISLFAADGDITLVAAAVGSGVTVAGSGQVTLDANTDAPLDEDTAPEGSIISTMSSRPRAERFSCTPTMISRAMVNGDVTSGGGAILDRCRREHKHQSGKRRRRHDPDRGRHHRRAGIGLPVPRGLRRLDRGHDGDRGWRNRLGLNINKYDLGTLRLNGASNNYYGCDDRSRRCADRQRHAHRFDPIGRRRGGHGRRPVGRRRRDDDGTINAYITVQPDGILDPGDLNCTDPNPGQLTVTGNITLAIGSTFRVQLDGLAPGSSTTSWCCTD